MHRDRYFTWWATPRTLRGQCPGEPPPGRGWALWVERRPQVQLSIQSSLLSVSDLDRSIEFYRDIFDLPVVSRSEQVAALMISETIRRQVLVLREIGSRYPTHAGGGTVGLRLLAFEAGSLDELDVIEQRLVGRQVFVTRHRTKTWEAIVSVDPDRIQISVASSVTGGTIPTEAWNNLDDMVFGVGE
jgi:hypothetical protein